MPLSLNSLKPASGARRTSKRLGRGNASGRGSYSTRGIKGQRARQGGRKGLTQLGVKHFITRLPKTRGFTSFGAKSAVVTVASLAVLPPGSTVTPQELKAAGLVATIRHGVKLIGTGTLPKLIVKVQAATPGARAAVEAAGGSLELIPLVSRRDSH